MFRSSWYLNLTKPMFSPPNWVFAPVWTFLYILIFISFALFLNNAVEVKKGCAFFAVQMFLNLIWPYVFFGLKSIKGALFVIFLLAIFLILTMNEFSKASTLAFVFLIPYFLWVLFALYLNIGYLILN